MQTAKADKIKIIFSLPGLYVGGAERFTVDLILNLDKEKFEPKLLLLEGVSEEASAWSKILLAQDIEIISLGKRKKKDRLKTFYKYYKALKMEKPDILHAQLFSADLYGRIASKLAGVPAMVVTEQNLNYVDGRMRILFKWLTMPFVSKIVAISEAVKGYLISREKVTAGKIDIIYNGAKSEDFLFNERNYFYSGKTVIGSVGRLTEQKNFFCLVEAINQIDREDVKCMIAGDGELKGKLEAQMRDKNLTEKIELVGWQKTSEFLKKIDIFVLPSKWEGLGIAVIEAGLSGLPVIVSDIDGLKELVKDGQDGLYFKNDDPSDLKDKIKYLLDRLDERKRIGKALQGKMKENFSMEKISRQYEELYAQTLGIFT